jgi:hypothetical protein
LYQISLTNLGKYMTYLGDISDMPKFQGWAVQERRNAYDTPVLQA